MYLRAVKFLKIRAKFFTDTEIKSHKTDDGCLANAAL